jgi:integrase
MAERELVERNIYRRRDADGRWRYELNFRDSDGRGRRQTVDGGLKAARVALADVKARMGRGQRVAPSPHLTFGEAAEKWRTAQAGRLRPATRAAYESQLATHLLPRWRRRRLDTFTVDDVARLAEEMRLDGKKAWTVRGALVVAGRVFEFARRRLAWAGENPVRLLDRSERPRSDQRDRRVLTSDELEAVIAAAHEPYRLAFELAAMTGARLGEVLGLRWRNIDLDAGTATIEAQLDRRGNLAECKTARSRRTIELPSALLAPLRAHKLRSRASRGDDFVVVARTGPPRPLDHRTVTRAFAGGVKRAGIAEPTPTFHDLRHGFASRFIASGGDLVTLSAHLGHRSPGITASAYSHEFERHARADERRARLDAMFRGSVVAASDRHSAVTDNPAPDGEVLDLQAKRETA